MLDHQKIDELDTRQILDNMDYYPKEIIKLAITKHFSMGLSTPQKLKNRDFGFFYYYLGQKDIAIQYMLKTINEIADNHNVQEIHKKLDPTMARKNIENIEEEIRGLHGKIAASPEIKAKHLVRLAKLYILNDEPIKAEEVLRLHQNKVSEVRKKKTA